MLKRQHNIHYQTLDTSVESAPSKEQIQSALLIKIEFGRVSICLLMRRLRLSYERCSKIYHIIENGNEKLKIRVKTSNQVISIEDSLKKERYKQYLICKARGHHHVGYFLGEWTKCKYCETELKYETIVHERCAPNKILRIC